MLPQVAVYGDGIAATCCAKLLEIRRVDVAFRSMIGRTAVRPTLLVNPQTQKLLTDVFGGGGTLFSGAQVIRRRVVLWGDTREAQSFPHSGLAIREGALLERLWTKVDSNRTVPDSPEWCVHSSHPSPDTARHDFGTRRATAVTVGLKNLDDDTCWIESLFDGWLFLVPSGQGRGSLIVVGGNPAAILGQSRLIASQIVGLIGSGVEFAAYPRIFVPLCGRGWLACGTAAMAFDPICGEGAGHAVREAILAAAVLGTMHNGADEMATLGQYTSRLLAGFMRHLEICKQFYVSARQSDWWNSEIAALDRGLDWTRAQLAVAPSPTSRLVGFDLQMR